MVTDPIYNERNSAQTARLKGLRQLSQGQLDHPVGEHWTVGVALAHIGYWDGRALGALETWRRHGFRLELWGSDEQAVNDMRLAFWKAIPPRDALEQAIGVAEALDRVIRDLSAVEVETVAAQRYRVLERAIHRVAHLDEVQRAIAG